MEISNCNSNWLLQRSFHVQKCVIFCIFHGLFTLKIAHCMQRVYDSCALFPIAFGNWIFMHPISTITSLFHHHAKDWILWLNHTFIHCKISRILGFSRFNDSVGPKLRFFTLTVAITQLLPIVRCQELFWFNSIFCWWQWNSIQFFMESSVR